MKAFTLDAFGSPPGLRDDLPEPDGELIVSVRATSVNPIDAIVAAGFLREFATCEFAARGGGRNGDRARLRARRRVFGRAGRRGGAGARDAAVRGRRADRPRRPGCAAAKIDELGLRVPLCEAFSLGEIGGALSAFGEHKQGKLSIV